MDDLSKHVLEKNLGKMTVMCSVGDCDEPATHKLFLGDEEKAWVGACPEHCIQPGYRSEALQ